MSGLGKQSCDPGRRTRTGGAGLAVPPRCAAPHRVPQRPGGPGDVEVTTASRQQPWQAGNGRLRGLGDGRRDNGDPSMAIPAGCLCAPPVPSPLSPGGVPVSLVSPPCLRRLGTLCCAPLKLLLECRCAPGDTGRGSRPSRPPQPRCRREHRRCRRPGRALRRRFLPAARGRAAGPGPGPARRRCARRGGRGSAAASGGHGGHREAQPRLHHQPPLGG